MKTRRKIKAVKMCSVDDCDCCKRIRRYYKRCVACETNLIARNTKKMFAMSARALITI